MPIVEALILVQNRVEKLRVSTVWSVYADRPSPDAFLYLTSRNVTNHRRAELGA